MTLLSEVSQLIIKDLKLEFRQRYSFFSILLYVLLVIFVIYLSLSTPGPGLWNTLLWIILLFGAVNAIAKSFVQEGHRSDLYYYSIANPRAVIIAKMIYNVGVMVVVTLLSFGFYVAIMGFPVVQPLPFFLSIALGALGFALCFTLVAAIASRAGQNMALMAILSIPIFIPLLLLLMAFSSGAVMQEASSGFLRDTLLLCAIDVVVAALALLLFPYLWRD